MTWADGCRYASLVGNQPAVDLVRNPASQEAQRLGLGISAFHPTLHICLPRSETTPLRDGDAMQCCIHLAIAAPVETMPRVVGGPDGNRCGAVPPSKCRPAPEPVYASNFADDLRCG